MTDLLLSSRAVLLTPVVTPWLHHSVTLDILHHGADGLLHHRTLHPTLLLCGAVITHSVCRSHYLAPGLAGEGGEMKQKEEEKEGELEESTL